MTSCIVSNEIAKTPEKDEGKDDKDNEIDQWKNLGNRSKVTKSDKWIIWKFGEHSKQKYKHWSDIPDMVNNSEIDRSKSIGRIYLNTFYIFLVIVSAYAIVKYSKMRQAEGYSMEGENRKRNERWQKERLEREAKAKEEA
eukprot:01162.XXX_3080_4397_1 [CDS] Oithona nana genome sequencing.